MNAVRRIPFWVVLILSVLIFILPFLFMISSCKQLLYIILIVQQLADLSLAFTLKQCFSLMASTTFVSLDQPFFPSLRHLGGAPSEALNSKL